MKLLVVAGEVSGDQHAAALLDALSRRVPGLETLGVGGDRCAERGTRLLAHQKDLAVVGIVEALGKIRFARRLIHRLVAEACAAPVDAAVLVDSPDFNIPLARRLAARGIPVVFYVSPQVWAWRSGRARTLTRLGRRILVLFAFEKRWYDARGLGEKVRWVGHPLVDVAEAELSGRPVERGTRPRVVLMPGSRRGEIRRLLPLIRDAAERLRAERPEVEIVLVRADSVPETLLEEVAGPALASWRVVTGPHLALLAASDVLVVASGTATVEGVLARIPMVVVYRVNPLSYLVGKFLVKVPDVAMANIVTRGSGEERTVPELIQRAARPERIVAEVLRLLDDPALAARTCARLAAGQAELGPPGASDRAAEAILEALGSGGPR